MPSLFRFSSTDTHPNPMNPSSTSLTSPEDIDIILNDLQRGNQDYRKILQFLSSSSSSSSSKVFQRTQNNDANMTKVNVSKEEMDLLKQRDAIKASFISRKQAVRALIKLLSTGTNTTEKSSSSANAAAVPSSLQQLIQQKEQTLSRIQAEFRECDADFKNLSIASQRQSSILIGSHPLSFDSTTTDSKAVPGPSNNHLTIERKLHTDGKKVSNNDLLNSTLNTHTKTHDTLKEALVTVVQTKVIGTDTVVKLQEDHEKLDRIDNHLNGVQSELDVSRMLLIRIFKRLYTDRVIIALATLCVLGLLGIIIYAAIKPDQKTFKVPDEVLPPLKK